MIEKLLNRLNKNISLIENKLPAVTTGAIEYDGQSIFLQQNGIPSSLMIQYTGVVYFENATSPLIKVKFSKNAIFMFNFFKVDFDETIFRYSGNLKITNCKIMSFNQSSFYPTINSKIGDEETSKSDTYLEDNDMILHDYTPKAIAKKARGISPVSYPLNRFDEYGNIQKYGRKQRNEIATTIANTIISSSTKSPTATKPTVSKPTVSKPTVSKPTVTATRVEKKGGKY